MKLTRLVRFIIGFILVVGCTSINVRAAVYDISTDFSTNGNPSGVWRYGYKTNLSGVFTLFGFSKSSPDENGFLVFDWAKNTYEPSAVYFNPTTNTSTSGGGTGVYPPKSVWLIPGADGNPDNFGAIRFTAPSNGNYRLESFVRSPFTPAVAGDTDFHVVMNGTEVFGVFLPTNAPAGYTNTISLNTGDTLDFLVGRGADGHVSASLLLISARITLLSIYDVSRDFSTNSNPAGVWSYGYKTNLSGAVVPFTYKKYSPGDNGVLAFSWSKNGSEPSAIYFNGTTNTIVANAGAELEPPGSVWCNPGVEGHSDNYGAIRFTVPPGGGGYYDLRTTVRSYIEGAGSGDTDFHVVKNGVELFGQFLPGSSGTGYTNTLVLAEGDTIDFLVGRGADGLVYASGLRIQATLTPFAAFTNRFLNVDFGAGSNKVGRAAVGQSTGDYWNRYNKQPSFNGAISNLSWADGTVSSVTVSVTNAPAYFSISTGDPMYDSYVYSSGVIGVSLSNLAPGLHDFYIYGHGSTDEQNGVYQIISGANSYALKQTTTNAGWNSTNWQESIQYVVYRGVSVAFGQLVVLIVTNGTSGFSLINGLQIISPPTVLAIFPNGGYFINLTNITLTTSVSNSVMRYTLDGSTPSAASPQYTNAIIITNAVLLQAQVFSGSTPASEIVSAVFSRVYALPNDGIPASWRIQYFGTNYLTDPRAAADADPDGDGMTNLQEYQAGTDPTNAASVLKITSLRFMPVITWSSVSGINYQVERQYLNSTNWISLLPTVRATNSASIYVDLTTTNSQAIYRIQVIP